MGKVADFKAIKLKIASPDVILSWSRGEVTKPETINYRTQRPEKDGLFCEKIFGPTKDWECYCGKYKRIRYKGIVCDKCGVEVTRSNVRRERMGHIALAIPISHIWFLRGTPSMLGLFLDIPVQQLEKVIYFANYIVTSVDERAREEILKEIDKEHRMKAKMLKDKNQKQKLKEKRLQEEERLRNLRSFRVLSEPEYYDLSLKYGHMFEAGTGSEAVKQVIEKLDVSQFVRELETLLEKAGPAQREKILRRLKLARGFVKSGIRPEWMFLTVLPVLPPELRPMVQLDGGRYATSDLNDLYRRVINRNNRLKHLEELNAPEVIKRNEKRMLQEAVDALIDNSARKGQAVTSTQGGKRLLKSLADMLKGKQGRFRQNLLGKRVDYSGRSVIVVSPDLALHECGLPKKMALEMFKPFVIQKIIERELAYNIRGAGKLIENSSDVVWDILEEVIKDKYVLLNRAPTLHRLGIQAFQPLLIEGEAIHIHPLVCTAFNADFDGDQMAVHLPLSLRSQEEAKTRVLSSLNLLKQATGNPISVPSRDIVLGCYWMSKIKSGERGEGMIFASTQEAILAHSMEIVSVRARIKVRPPTQKSHVQSEKKRKKSRKIPDESLVETCVGRILFNEIFPADFHFINEELHDKTLEALTAEIIERYGFGKAAELLDEIKKLGFEYSTRSGLSWGMDDLVTPPRKWGIVREAEKEVREAQDQCENGLLTHEERKTKIIEIWYRAIRAVHKEVRETADPYGSVVTIVGSGSRGKWDQPNQMMGMKGLVANPAGDVIELPIKSNFKEGFNVLEYFISTHGARKGTTDTALRTATAGYLTRRLVDVAQDVIIKEKDCGDKNGITLIRADSDACGIKFGFYAFGRFLIDGIDLGEGQVVPKHTIVNQELAKRIDRTSHLDRLRVRSPLRCKAIHGLCRVCYGYDLGKNSLVELGEAVGIIAAQAIGEPGTQLTMRTFHTGGVAGGIDITQGLPRAEEIFELRSPKVKAIISDFSGRVASILTDERERVVKIHGKNAKNKTVSREYRVPSHLPVFVREGDEVKAGDKLTSGHIDIRELFKVTGKENTERYIVNQIQEIYASQGASIHNKHIEVIIRQMFSRVRVKDAGNTSRDEGEVVEKAIVLEENKELNANQKAATYDQIILGISKVALSTESFLSAASFQETARVLIRAAIEGRIDRLRSLKENVIIGKLIPAGTGFKNRN